MKIGVDFGTRYSKIAYLQDRRDLRMFRYPVAQGQEYIPTAVAYPQEVGNDKPLSIGRGAYLSSRNKGAFLCENFKMMLPLATPDEWHQRGWAGRRSPAEVTRDYFQQLLRDAKDSVEHQHEKIDSLVVSVPEVWQRSASNRGAEALRHILVDELKLPVDRLLSEPVCAATYYAHEYQRRSPEKSDPFHLLVCDMGGGTFDVALCRVHGKRIEVLEFDGNDEEGTRDGEPKASADSSPAPGPGIGLAGVTFDRNVVRAACLAALHSEPAWTDPRVIELQEEFEKVKINETNEDPEIFDLLLDQRATPERQEAARTTPIYTFRGGPLEHLQSVSLSQVLECFAPVAGGIRAVLNRLQTRAKAKGILSDWSGTRLAIVGGFGQYPLVERTILETLGIAPTDDRRFDKTIHGDGRFYAIACGAALIAENLYDDVEYYPHTLGLEISLIVEGKLRTEVVPIIVAGKMQAGQARTTFARGTDGRPLVVTVRHQRFDSLPAFIQLRGAGRFVRMTLPQAEYPPLGQYHVGVRVDRSNLGSLIFQPVEGGEPRIYSLGDVYAALTVQEGEGAG